MYGLRPIDVKRQAFQHANLLMSLTQVSLHVVALRLLLVFFPAAKRPSRAVHPHSSPEFAVPSEWSYACEVREVMQFIAQEPNQRKSFAIMCISLFEVMSVESFQQ